MKPLHEVIISGLGIACPFGVGVDNFWARLLESGAADGGERPPGPVPVPGPAYFFAPEFEAERYAEARSLRKVSELTRLVTVAALESLEMAAVPEDPAARDQVGLYLGTCFGSSRYHLEYHEALRRAGLSKASALLFTQSVFNAATGHLSKLQGLRGPCHTLVGGETVGLEALGTAFDRLRLGVHDIAVAGGADQYDEWVHSSVYGDHLVGDVPGALEKQVGPLVEGAALLVLETGKSAAARGVSGASVLGFSRARGRCESMETTIENAVERACGDAGISPEDIDLVVSGAAGGTCARHEIAALERLDLGARWVAPKGRTGEGFAFTGAMQALVATLALTHGVCPPTWAGRAELRTEMTEEPLLCAVEVALVVGVTSRGGAAALLLAAPGKPR